MLKFSPYLFVVFLIFMILQGCGPQKRDDQPVSLQKKTLKTNYSVNKTQTLRYIKYTTKKGDTIWKISKAYGVSPETIVKVNRIPDVTDVKIGKTLLIPVPQTFVTHPSVVKGSVNVNQHLTVKQNLPVSKHGFVWPLKRKVISRFNDYKNGRAIKGIDIEAMVNDDILAAKDGKVIVVSNNPSAWGKSVILEHGQNMHTWYANNSKIFVSKGMRVKRGQVIAKAGNRYASERPRLHFKIFVRDKPVNPLIYLPH